MYRLPARPFNERCNTQTSQQARPATATTGGSPVRCMGVSERSPAPAPVPLPARPPRAVMILR